MKSYAIRPANLADAAQFAAVESSACERFREIAGLAWIADAQPTSLEDHLELINAGTVWVAVDRAEKIMGFLLAETYGDVLHICEFAVGLDHQRQGIGKLLVEAAVDYAHKTLLSSVTLTTFRDVSWNEPYYQHLGFRTLEPDQLDDILLAIFAREALIGLPVEPRCAMRLMLNASVSIQTGDLRHNVS